MNDKGYEELANAIVLQAVTDYRTALTALKDAPTAIRLRSSAAALERFFRSPWYRTLTSVDAEWLIGRLKQEVNVT